MPFPVCFSDAELLEYLDWLDGHHPRFPRPNFRALLEVPGVATVETLVFLCPSFPLLRPDGFAQLLYLPDVGLFYPTFLPLVWEDRAEYWEWCLSSHVAHLCYMDLLWRDYLKTRVLPSACRQLELPPDRDRRPPRGHCIALPVDDCAPPRKRRRI
ncbi:hypothetical protein AMEX_G18894 [Astyanax mexicanus]|uniref:Uncharacterized protein n=1 Tax=Astyanax mexicanus TaxID=7994 RepID=A0A8T2L8P9_ASTMX|nr:hypothetical protein AMEX_G18894 [Astyanax mexicanus]